MGGAILLCGGVTAMPDRAGQQLGNYRLLRLLGRGGFAEVYLGEHVYLKRRAALKVLHIALEEDYVKQVAAALQYAHNHQVIHRDVKPENMLLGSQQEVLLSDFGISLLSPSPEQLSTQEMAGTLPYMAPEQIRGKPVFASDQYSLAVVVYEWLCGVCPFEGSMTEVMVQQLTMPPPALREKDPSLPEAVEEVVLKALAKDPQDRYISVHLFAQALEQASQASRLGLHATTEVTAPLDAVTPASSGTPPAIS